MFGRFRDGQLLRRVVDAVKDLVPDILMGISESGGVRSEEMDSSHVSLVSIHLLPLAFTELKVEGTPHLGINMNSLSKILKCGNATDTVTWMLNSVDRTELQVVTQAAPKSGRKPGAKGRECNFTLKLIDIDREQLTVPDTDFWAHIYMRSSLLQRIVKDLIGFADAVLIVVNRESITFKIDSDIGPGSIVIPNIRPSKLIKASFDCFNHPRAEDDGLADDTESAFVFIKTNEDEKTEENDSLEMKFALKFLQAFTRCTSLAPHVQLSMSSGVPLLVRYPLYGNIAQIHPEKETEPIVVSAPVAKDEKKKTVPKKKQQSLLDMKAVQVLTVDEKGEPTTKKRKSSSSSVAKNSGTDTNVDQIVGTVAFYLAPKIDEDIPDQV